jgi:hypothetical protein
MRRGIVSLAPQLRLALRAAVIGTDRNALGVIGAAIGLTRTAPMQALCG